MTDIFEEVDEDLSHDRYARLWRRYGSWVIIAAAGIVVATAAFEAWKAYQRTHAEGESLQFITGMQMLASGNGGQAITTFENIEKTSSLGYATLARFQKAAALIQAGDRREAVAEYDAVAADTKVDAVLRDYAQLLAAQALIDTTDMATTERRLTPLLGPDNAWRFSARELLALAALKRSDLDRARKELAVLTDDPTTPQGVRARAAELLAAIGGA